MGACADLWQEEVDRIIEQFRLNEISKVDAIRELQRKGFDTLEATDLLIEATS